MTGESLVKHLFLGWRLAGRSGFRPRLHLLALIRGCAAMHAVTYRLDPDSDSVLPSLEEVLLAASIHQFGELASFERVATNFERYAAALTELPQRIDAALTNAAAGPEGRSRGARGARRGRGGSVSLVASLLLALAAVVLLADKIGGVWARPAGAVAFLLVGALLLRLVGRQ